MENVETDTRLNEIRHLGAGDDAPTTTTMVVDENERLKLVNDQVEEYSSLATVALRRKKIAEENFKSEVAHAAQIAEVLEKKRNMLTNVEAKRGAIREEVEKNEIYVVRMKDVARRLSLADHRELMSHYSMMNDKVESLINHRRALDVQREKVQNEINIRKGDNEERKQLKMNIAQLEQRLESVTKQKTVLEQKLNSVYEQTIKK